MQNEYMYFDVLMGECRKILKAAGADQAVAVRSEKGMITAFANRGILDADFSDEDSFISDYNAEEAGPVERMVCMWKEGIVDCPSEHLWKGMVEAGIANGDTKVLMFGFQGPNIRMFKDLFGV